MPTEQVQAPPDSGGMRHSCSDVVHHLRIAGAPWWLLTLAELLYALICRFQYQLVEFSGHTTQLAEVNGRLKALEERYSELLYLVKAAKKDG